MLTEEQHSQLSILKNFFINFCEMFS